MPETITPQERGHLARNNTQERGHPARNNQGGKANALHFLLERGLRIPPWFVISPHEKIDPTSLIEKINSLNANEFAVRSSALAEDGLQHSFAGQFDTFLHVPREQVITRIEQVRNSATSPHVLSYCREKNLPPPPPPAVIVQVMIQPSTAGVAFSADPVHGHRDHVVICATEGTAEKLVSGEVDGERWTLDSNNKTILSEGTILTETQLQKIANLARECEIHCGRPQDIEWAIDLDGTLWLLQSRAITTLGHLPDPADDLRVWDNSNIAESYCGVTTPMTFSFARRIYEAVYREFCRLLSVPESRIARADDVFPNMLGLIRGRVYYNLLSWYRVLALLPGFQLNRNFMEQMMGVREPLPDRLVQMVIRENQSSRLADWLALIKTCFGLIRQLLGLNRQIKNFNTRLDLALSPPEIPLEKQSIEQLAASYRSLEAKLLKRWDAPLVNDFFAMIFYGLLGSLTKKWLPAQGENFQNELLLDAGEMISAQPPKRMEAIAALLRPHPEIAKTLADPTLPISEKTKHLSTCKPAFTLYETYLEEFGDRCLEELKLESPTVRDDPSSLLLSLGAMAMREAPTPLPPQPPLTSPLKGLKSFLFRRILKQARTRVLARENLRFRRTLLFGRVRSIIREIGQRLHADNVLDDPRDVFYLEIGELLATTEATNTTANFNSLTTLRKNEFTSYHNTETPPDRITTHGPLHRYDRFETPARSTDNEASWKGVGACPGIVRAIARVVLDPRDASLNNGEILVARQTDPGWVVLFPLAAGLLVERGSLLSHSAIVSREMRIPCIVSLPNITTNIKSGDLIEMNGSTGEIHIIKT